MKQLRKAIAVIMCIVLTLTAAPLSGFVGIELPTFATKAKAIEASDLPADFDLAKYNVKTIFSSEYGNGTPYNIFYDDINKYSCSKVVYNAFSQDADFVASVEAWEAIRLIANPSHLTEHLEYQQQYEEIIFAVLFSALKNEKYAEFSYSNMLTKVTGLTDNLLSTSRTAQLLDKTSLDGTEADEIKDIAFAFLTDGKDVESAWTAFGEYTDIVNKCNSIVDKSISTVVNAANIVTSTVMYVSMLEQGEQILTYLTDLKTKSPNSVFGAAVSTVINTLCQDWLGVVEKAIFDSGFVIGMEATEKLFDYAWSGCCAMCPFLGGMAIGEVIGKLACNILFSTESLIEQYEYLKIVTQLETAACSLYQQYGNSCKTSVNSTNAAKLMFATDFSYALYNLGAEAAVEMMNIGCNKGVVNKVSNIFGVGKEQSFDEFEESVESCVNSFELGYSNMKNYWKFCIEEDYPEFFVSLKDKNIAPKYIESINIEKSEVTFRVGEVMNFKWTINPTGYEGGVGLKSDNEAVIKSSEPMDILAYATTTGTANVTIYSLNDPEICDTIKITVIGEDDEGTTEADSKYVTGKCGDNLTWVLNQKTGRLTITGTGEMYNWSYASYQYNPSPWYRYSKLIKNVSCSDGVANIGDAAFYNCINLERIDFPSGLLSIGISSFRECTKLLNVIIPNTVTRIGRSAFWGCESLTSISIPDSVTGSLDSTFAECPNITTAKIGNGITQIDKLAFIDSIIDNLTIGKNVRKISMTAFGYCNVDNVHYYGSIDNWRNINFEDKFSFCWGTDIHWYTSDGNLITTLTIPNNYKVIDPFLFWSFVDIEKVIIGNKVETISELAFAMCDNLKEVVISDSVKAIGDSAFWCCGSLSSVNIPDSVTSIGASAFRACGSLPSITIPNSVTALGENAFSGCDNLTSVTIGNGLSTISYESFYHCDNLESVTIGNRVATVEDRAFYYCDSLTDVYYTGTKEQWKNIEKSSDNWRLTNATIHYNFNQTAHTHSYTSSVTAAETCEKTGVITYRCSCGYSYIEVIPAKGHTPSEWETVLASTTEAEGKKIKKCTVCGETIEESIIPKIDEAVVPTPSQSTINYGDSIVLHVDAELIPENGYVEWVASNANFTFSISEDGSTCTITPSVSGETTFTATVYNEDGVPVSTDEQVMTAKAGFFWKIIAFFKRIFGLSKVILQSV